jgi:AbiV family abortive infection protein
MHTLSMRELHELRLAIFDNAEALHCEANLLLQHGMYSRAYLLAHFCFEELGKIPIVVGVIGKLTKGEAVDWKKVKKRFLNHEAKIESQNGHFYAFGLEVDLIHDSDVQWLLSGNTAVPDTYAKKNISTYVDARAGKILRPSEEIRQHEAEKLVSFAFECLRAHWRSENFTNPIVYAAQGMGNSKNDA